VKSAPTVELLIAIVCIVIILLLPPLGVLISFIGVMLYLVISRNRRDNFRSIGFVKPPGWVRTVLISLALGIAIQMSFQILFDPLIEMATGSKIDLSALSSIRGNLTVFLYLLAIGWGVGGFLEEILFRGFLLTRIAGVFTNRALGNALGIAATAFAFGFSHLYQGWSGVISTAVIAALFGVIFVSSRKVLWYCILTHGFVNTVGLTIMYLGAEEKLRSLLF